MMKSKFRNLSWLLIIVLIYSCSKKDENYKLLIPGGETYYPGVIAGASYRAGNLRTMLIWNPSPDPNITKYKIYWNNKQDSMIVNADSHLPTDTVKVIIPGLREASYAFIINSIDNKNHVSIPMALNNVRVYGPIYQSGIFNRGYNADTPYVVDLARGAVKLKFNKPDSVNVGTVVNYTDNSGASKTLNLRPDSNSITLPNYKFGTEVTYQSTYLPQTGALDRFTVANVSTYPVIRRTGDVTSIFVKNAGSPFLRGDNGNGKWGLPRDWQVNAAAVNQNNNTGGGWSTDNGGVIHFESKDYGGAGVNNGKVSQTVSLPAGSYQLDFTTGGYNSTFTAKELVVAGTSLPDIDNIGTPLAVFNGDQNNMGGTHTLAFTLTQTTTITFGWVVSTTSTTYLQFTKVRLRIL